MTNYLSQAEKYVQGDLFIFNGIQHFVTRTLLEIGNGLNPRWAPIWSTTHHWGCARYNFYT